MCSVLSSLTAEAPATLPGSSGTPDVRALLATALSDLAAAKERAAALTAEPPTRFVDTALRGEPRPTNGDAAAQEGLRLQLEGSGAVHEDGVAATAAVELGVVVAMEEAEAPALEAVMVAADAVAADVEGAAVACMDDCETTPAEFASLSRHCNRICKKLCRTRHHNGFHRAQRPISRPPAALPLPPMGKHATRRRQRARRQTRRTRRPASHTAAAAVAAAAVHPSSRRGRL